MVGERSNCTEGDAASIAGAIGSENADMSNDKGGEKPPRRKPKGFALQDNPRRVSRPLRRSRKAKLMGNRLIFLYHRGGAEQGRSRIGRVGNWIPAKVCRQSL